MSLEDMNAKFKASLRGHGKEKLLELKLGAKKGEQAAR